MLVVQSLANEASPTCTDERMRRLSKRWMILIIFFLFVSVLYLSIFHQVSVGLLSTCKQPQRVTFLPPSFDSRRVVQTFAQFLGLCYLGFILSG